MACRGGAGLDQRLYTEAQRLALDWILSTRGRVYTLSVRKLAWALQATDRRSRVVVRRALEDLLRSGLPATRHPTRRALKYIVDVTEARKWAQKHINISMSINTR